MDREASTMAADVAGRAAETASLPFGAVIGVAPGGVEAYSSDYETVDPERYPDRRAFRNYVDGIYTGYKWQCVEFARRWLLLNRGVIFDDVAMAYDIFALRRVRRPATGEILPLNAYPNGARTPPGPGAMLVWDKGPRFEGTGHVAIVTELGEGFVRIAEQNYRHVPWGAGRDYSRELKTARAVDGGFWIESPVGEAELLGWMLLGPPRRDAIVTAPRARSLQRLIVAEAPAAEPGRCWLNPANPEEAVYLEALGGPLLATAPGFERRFGIIARSIEMELRHASEELHQMFMHATDRVLEDDERLRRFAIPEVLWPRIRRSWANRRQETVTGRFDFCLTPRHGLKLYEYNTDSAACHMEAGRVQGAFLRHHRVELGRDAGGELTAALVAAWRRLAEDGPIHLLVDPSAPDELYHALYMRATMRAAGITCPLITDLGTLKRDPQTAIVRDAEGLPVRRVWKTWAWETAFDELRAELAGGRAPARRRARPGGLGLSDVLLDPEVLVYDPLWTVIPNNKAILPVLCELYPDSPWLLRSGYELDRDFLRRGHVAKPIVGRCGENVTLVDAETGISEATEGRFGDRPRIYQELCPLPRIAGRWIQLSGFTVSGRYAGAVLRAEDTPIITGDSDVVALVVVPDGEFRHLARRHGRRAGDPAGGCADGAG